MGRGFAFVDRQKHISIDTGDFYIDLVFYNIKLKRYVLFELKTRPLTHADVGQLDMYVQMYNDLFRRTFIVLHLVLKTAGIEAMRLASTLSFFLRCTPEEYLISAGFSSQSLHSTALQAQSQRERILPGMLCTDKHLTIIYPIILFQMA